MYRPSQTPRLTLSSTGVVTSLNTKKKEPMAQSSHYRISKESMKVVVFHWRHKSTHLCYTSHDSSQCQTRVKLNRVFFPRYFYQARSLGCGFLGTVGISLIHSYDEAFGYLKRVIVTPAVYPRLLELLRFNIQSTGQKSETVNVRKDHLSPLRIPRVRTSSSSTVLMAGQDTKLESKAHTYKRPQDCLITSTDISVTTNETIQVSVNRPTDPITGANPFPEVTDLICRLPLPTLFYRLEAVHLEDLMRISHRLIASLGFSRAVQRARDTTETAVLYGNNVPISG
uniref:Ski_Sno domain-containing protein n=1 Tax=Heterorhabditis bacteriophora TaxID=37862 RepID=A0A1I7WKN0_HETBA